MAFADPQGGLYRRPPVIMPPRPVPRPAVPPRPGVAPPAPPNFAELLAQLAASAPNRSDDEWKTLLDARTRPFTDAINSSTSQARAFNEYAFETKAAANKGLGEGFLSILTGGKTGDDAMAYAREQWGGSYLPAQAMHLAANELTRLTTDFDSRDWEISGQYLKAMQEVPAIREELRATLEKQDMDEDTRKRTEAVLLMDESWRLWQENRKNFEQDREYEQSERKIKREQGESAREFAERKRITNEQLAMARQKLGLDTTDKLADNRTAAKNAEIRAADLELKKAKQAYTRSKDKVSQRQAQERINIAKGNLDVAKLNAKKNSGTSSNAQKDEADLAIMVLTEERDTILGKSAGAGLRRVGGMLYPEAYTYVRGLADAQMGSYRNPAYIDAWVKRQLKALFGTKTSQRRSGR